MNLSNFTLKETDLSVLNRGLTFIPTVSRFPYKFILDCQNRNIRNLKLRDYFQNSNRDYDPEAFHNRFLPKSDWIPPTNSLSKATLDAIIKVTSFTNKLISKKFIRNSSANSPFVGCGPFLKTNMTPQEIATIAELKNQRNVIIKPADKGGAVVCMDPTLYRAEGLRQLTNAKYYATIEQSLAIDTVPRINYILYSMFSARYLSFKQYSYLKCSIPLTPRAFYLLPKVHKPRSKWPHPHMPEGRPIVSDTGSETERICELIDFYLKPLATGHPSYLKDTYDFVNKIKDTSIPTNALLVTADVSALYTNMLIDRSIEVVKDAFTRHPDASRPDKHILELLTIALTQNDFMFDNQLYVQKCGTAMGKRFAPNLANLYLLPFDHAACNDFTIKPLLYFRYIDDIFFIWTGSRQQLKQYESFLNNIIPGITITMTVRNNITEFLDTSIYKHKINSSVSQLKTRVFFKPTDTHQLLHGSSCHPRHTAKGILKSQFIRFKRICSTREEYNFACQTLYKVLKNRGYSRSLYRELKRLIWDTEYTPPTKQTLKLFPLINYFDPVSTKIMKYTHQVFSNLPFLTNSRIVEAYKIHSNLKTSLVKSNFALTVEPVSDS